MRTSQGYTSFAPTGLWRNRHVQTVSRGVLGLPRRPNWTRERYRSVHGDYLSVDRLPLSRPRARMLFLHGITGCSAASPIPESAQALADLGVEPWALNLRGADGVCPSIPRLYHAGCSDDLDSVFWQLPQDLPWRFVGFSLGATLLLKWLGELDRLDGARALAISCPYDLAECAHNLEQTPMARAYRWVLVRRLRSLALNFAQTYPTVLSPETVRECRTFFDFDDQITAPIHGFDGARDYWRQNSSIHFLDQISTPTVLLHAADDPFQPRPPVECENKNLSWELYPFGGHVGFQNGLFEDWLVHRIVTMSSG